MRELERLLPTLEPPAGGLARLQKRVQSGRRRQRPSVRQSWVWTTAACAAAVIALAVWVPQRVFQQSRTDSILESIEPASPSRLPSDGIVVAHGAALELPSGQSNVRLYLVLSVPSRTREP